MEGRLVERRHDGPIHLLVTDVLMPHVSGPEQFRKLSESRPGLRAIFMSGHVGSIANADGKTPGDAWLVKPFAMSALIACVREVIGTEERSWKRLQVPRGPV